MKQFVLNIILIIVSVCTYGQTYITVYTKFGNPIEAMIRTEMTNTEKEDALEWVSTNFPNATILSEPTALYNCHSYAWNMQDGGPTCWINGNANLSVYVGEIANYYITNNIITPYGYTLDYIWSIVDNKEGENVIGTVATVTENGDNANISFNKSGLYTITCDVYTSMGEYISSYWIEGVVE